MANLAKKNDFLSTIAKSDPKTVGIWVVLLALVYKLDDIIDAAGRNLANISCQAGPFSISIETPKTSEEKAA